MPLPNGGGRAAGLDLPTMELDGAPYVPVFSSEQQFRQAADGMACTIAPVHEFARGLPPHGRHRGESGRGGRGPAAARRGGRAVPPGPR